MLKYSVSLFVILFVYLPSQASLYEQLCEFNPNWEKYSDRAPTGEDIQFQSEAQYIRTHLGAVLEILADNSTDELSTPQLLMRMKLMGVLAEYREGGIFPFNHYIESRIPVFIDQYDTHCAVAYLMQETGYEDLAREISNENNYAWVKDIQVEGLLNWQKFSGFTVEELKLIQGAYDFYPMDALFLPNKFEVPQKPEVIVRYFDERPDHRTKRHSPENIWLCGEGKDGVLNGKWEQNYGAGVPWIVGYFENGKRTGQWEEYYPGGNQLCRTECWRDDKLNGIRKRFNREGNLVEEIHFKNGEAMTKTNYDLQGSLRWVRTPLDSVNLYTEVYTFGGALIATGNEVVHNPGNLLWFQNIELTALNSFAITAREEVHPGTISLGRGFGYAQPTRIALHNLDPPLVEYHKVGEWKYYRESYTSLDGGIYEWGDVFTKHYPHFGPELFGSICLVDDKKLTSEYDSIQVSYTKNSMKEFRGYGNKKTDRVRMSYHQESSPEPGILEYHPYGFSSQFIQSPNWTIKEIGFVNEENSKTGIWKHFDEMNRLYKTEHFIIPRREEELMGDNNL